MQRTKTRLMSLTTAILMVLTLFVYLPYGAIIVNAQGTGTEKDPIIVKTYDELRAALDRSAATKDGEVFVKLGKDITQEDSLNHYNMVLYSSFEQEVTLDLNGHKLSRSTESVDSALFQLGENEGNNNYTLNIKDSAGGGEIYFKDKNTSEYKYIFWVRRGNLNIYDGIFNTDYYSHECIYTWGGTTNIYGGTFTARQNILRHSAGYLYIYDGTFNCTIGGKDRSYYGVYLSSNLGDFYVFNCTINCTNVDEEYECKLGIGGMGNTSDRCFAGHFPPTVEVKCDGVKQTDLDVGGFKGRKIVVTDITKIAAHIKNKKLLTEEQKLRADVNNDNRINVTDITKIAAHIKGKKLLS